MTEQQPEHPSVLPDDLAFTPAVRRRRRRRASRWARLTRRPRHWVRRHRALSVLLGVLGVLLLILLAWLWWLLHNLHRVPGFEFELGPDRPAQVGGQNILLVGLDCDTSAPKSDTLRACDKQQKIDLSGLDADRPTGVRSDVIMLLHLSEDGEHAQVVSIPRDSYVDIDGHGKTKINAAFSYGGPKLLGRTIEQNFGIRLDHMAVVDFNGFRDMTTAIGGVQVYVPEQVSAHGAVLWEKGWQTVEGDAALAYVRTRYGLARGDFDRVQRHQNFLRAVLQRMTDTSVVFNPVKLTNLVEAATDHIALDDAFTDGEIIDLARTGLSLGPDSVAYATVPYQGSATINGASVVLLKEKEARALFQAVAHDRFLSYLRDHQIETLPPETEVD